MLAAMRPQMALSGSMSLPLLPRLGKERWEGR